MAHAVQRIVILTGAGISAESGVPVFRGADGLWEGMRVEDVATPDAFRRHPERVQQFYDERRRALAGVQPNAAHRALARLDRLWPGELLLVTQNIDDLHERAGSRRILHMHGELLRARCLRCGESSAAPGPLLDGPHCPHCNGPLRPDVVWFGEMPHHMAAIERALSRCDLFVAIGTSGNVYPAAGFVDLATRAGARTLELNLDPSAASARFGESRLGRAGVLVPAFVDRLLPGMQRATVDRAPKNA